MLADRLKVLRAKAGLSQEALARVLGTTQGTIARWERGKREPAVSDLKRIADALGAHPAELVSEDSEADLISSVVAFLRGQAKPITITSTNDADTDSGQANDNVKLIEPDNAEVFTYWNRSRLGVPTVTLAMTGRHNSAVIPVGVPA